MNARPAKRKPRYDVWNMPVRIEMYEKPAAKLENEPSERSSSCLYAETCQISAVAIGCGHAFLPGYQAPVESGAPTSQPP